MPVCSLKRDRKGVDSDGRESGISKRVKGGETTNRIYCMKILFSIKEN